MAKFCIMCGAQLNDIARFCANCGAVVENSPPRNMAPQVQPQQTMNQPPMYPQGNSMGQPPGYPGHPGYSMPVGGNNPPGAYYPDQGIRRRFFSCNDRLNRQPYILRMLALYIVATIIMIPILIIDQDLEKPLAYVVGGVAFIPSTMWSVRRLHDLDRSGWFALLFLVPVVGFILSLVLIFKKGTTGPNQYGMDPLGGGWW